MDIRAVSTDFSALASYERLFKSCFPGASHLNVQYLDWLYARNPVGGVIGCDAWEGGALVAHYVCIPVDAILGGHKLKVMLSLNTATHPDFQGKGLFTRLAEATYEAGARAGMSGIYGVANANSTPGFVRKLGFTLVRPLDALVGFGRVDSGYPDVAETEFQRDWSQETLTWRIANPARPYVLVNVGDGRIGAEAHVGKFGLRAWDEVVSPANLSVFTKPSSVALRLHLGLRPRTVTYRRRTWFEIPQRFRPSPLNMIFKPLANGIRIPASDCIRLGQLDFDAF